jgi:hypothetical protein
VKPTTKAVTVFAFAGAATAFVPPTPPRADVAPLVPGGLHGDIGIVGFGVASIAGDRGMPLKTLHVRETFTNRADHEPWVIDVSDASVWLGGAAAETHPVFANSDALTLPLLIVGRGQHRMVDLYFPVGDTVDEDTLPYFSVTYRLHKGDDRLEAHATLARSDRWLDRDERGPDPGWATKWWSDPSYPWAQYRHRPGFATPRPPTKLEIVHLPRALYEVAPALPEDVAIEDWPRTDECDEW